MLKDDFLPFYKRCFRVWSLFTKKKLENCFCCALQNEYKSWTTLHRPLLGSKLNSKFQLFNILLSIASPHLAFTTTTTHYYLLGVLRPNPRSLSPSLSLSLSLHSSTGTKIITTRCSFADSCLYLWKKLTWGFKMWKHLSKWSVENEMRIWKAK